METNKHELVIRKINKNNIGNFLSMRTARPLNESQVRSLTSLLKAGEHFYSPVIANAISNGNGIKFRIIDGHHRLEAISRVIQSNPDFEIDVDFQLWGGLTEKEEVQHFDKHNMGLKQNGMSWLFVHQHEIPIVEKILSEFPILVDYGQIHGTRNSPWISISTLISAHWGAKQHIKRGTVYGISHMPPFKELGKHDYETMNKFGEDLMDFAFDMFGSVTVMKSKIMVLIYRLWYLNCIERPFCGQELLSRQRFSERLNDALHTWPVLIDSFHVANGAAWGSILIVKAEEDLVNKINYNRKSQKVISTYEAWK